MTLISAGQTYRMLGNETLWDTAHRTHAVLAAAEIPHAIVGGVAVCLHGYRRNTVDLDLLIRPDDAAAVKDSLSNAGFEWRTSRKEFSAPSGVVEKFFVSGARAGSGSEVRLPDPGDERVVTTTENLPVLSLAKLIEAKIACGEGSVRRAYKDFADFSELIAVRKLNQSFARHLHPSLRSTFRELVQSARGMS